ncbi:hypothetical protein EV421DRAFT_1909782 [Armillaria borealis]|uniref:Transmembrane protein n=1 Tax=Armillaria borealis TaxID=47425 RepID=A0AA39J1Q9_9AGAR|nr:hypothetical protein EV421DRAFT_1909782 [Armillaria borealis]
MVAEWFINGGNCDDNCTDVNIFFDTNLSDRKDGSDSYTNSRPTYPTFIFHNNITDLQANVPIFRTDHVLNNPAFGYDWKFNPASLVYYPFDCYTAEIHAFAQDAVTNQSVTLDLESLSGIVPTFLSGLKITSHISPDSPAYVKDAVFDIRVNIQRSTLVIGYCLIITVTFWLVTLMICLIMISTVVFGFQQRNEIVVVPIGTVFAFTQLRLTMPGAPDGFGDILDFAGLLPCLVLLSICAVTMAGIYLFADPHDPARRPFTWEEIGWSSAVKFWIDWDDERENALGRPRRTICV